MKTEAQRVAAESARCRDCYEAEAARRADPWTANTTTERAVCTRHYEAMRAAIRARGRKG